MNQDEFLARFEKTVKKLTIMPRPGQNIGEPQQQHMVLAMMILICMGNNTESETFIAVLEAAVDRMWGWDGTRFRAELMACNEAMVEAGTRFTCWFTEHGIHFDMNVPQ